MISELHPRDITNLLQNLVKEGVLLPSGKGRVRTYCIKGAETSEVAVLATNPPKSLSSSAQLADSSAQLGGSSAHLGGSSAQLGDDFTEKDSISEERLVKIAEAVSKKRKASQELVEATIVELCEHKFLTLNQIAKLLNRSPHGVRQRSIKPMLDKGTLFRRFPNNPNHEKQAYTSTKQE